MPMSDIGRAYVRTLAFKKSTSGPTIGSSGAWRWGGQGGVKQKLRELWYSSQISDKKSDDFTDLSNKINLIILVVSVQKLSTFISGRNLIYTFKWIPANLQNSKMWKLEKSERRKN